jgi:hypothetical protein
MAAQNVSGTITLNASFQEVISSGVVSNLNLPAIGTIQQTLINGTGAASAVDTIYAAQLTLAGAATHLNLHTGLTDLAGNAIAFARVRFWFVQNLTLTAGYLCNIYTRTGTDPVTWLPVTTTGALWAAAGGFCFGLDPLSTSTNGYVVGASAFDFTLDPGANTVSVNVILVGNSAA